MKTVSQITHGVNNRSYLYLLLLVLWVPLSGMAQSSPPPYYGEIEYHYDAAGNRVQRNVYVYPMSVKGVPDSTKVKSDNTSEAPPAANERLKDEAMEKAMRAGVSVYPNPAQALLNVTINTLQNGKEADILVFDNLGRLAARKKQTSNLDTINLEAMTTGIYFLQITIGKEVLVYKIVKE